jgi:uncharacterized protein (DUF486 family)
MTPLPALLALTLMVTPTSGPDAELARLRAALVAWGVALAESLLQVPANRIGFGRLGLGQLKILQEVITLAVFVPFAVLYMGEGLKLNYLWAGLCLLGTVYFILSA